MSKNKKANKFINRELSWLDFNRRVLSLSVDESVPLLERVNFLSISESNLDEFISVRFSEVVNKVSGKLVKPDITGMGSESEYRLVNEDIISFKKEQQKSFECLKNDLHKHGIQFRTYKSLNARELKLVNRYYETDIFPVLTPISYDTTKDFPFLSTRKLNLCVFLQDVVAGGVTVLSIIPLDNIRRFIMFESGDIVNVLPIEELIYANLESLFVGKKVLNRGMLRILRDEDQRVSENADIYLVDRMKSTLLKRRYSTPLFMELTNTFTKEQIKLLQNVFEINKENLYISSFLDFGKLKEISKDDDKLKYNKFTPQYPSELIGQKDIFSAINNGDILLHHPFDSYGTVVKFIEHASENDKVMAIKICLYRVSSQDSPIINALCKAAESGKQVSVLLELKARYDEYNNIILQDKLRASGCRVIFGLEDAKVHAKMCVVVKKSKKGLKIYSHVSTGNYNEVTANIYTDFSYFTKKEKIGLDLLNIFNSLSGFSEPLKKLTTVSVAPYNIRSTLEHKIDNEIQNAKKGKPSFMIFKMNSLSDKHMINKIYEASEAGVQVRIICRGVCSIKPINKNITIQSVVGRFLEHSRVYFFCDGGNKSIYISSADLLKRNLSHRVELLIPIKDIDCKNKIIHVINMYIQDRKNSFFMNKYGLYSRLDDRTFNVHGYFIDKAKQQYTLRNIPKVPINRK